MLCPRTGTPLKTVNVGTIPVRISEACGGVFFDNSTLEKFKDPADLRGKVLVKHLTQFATPLINENERIKCPKCTNIVMMRRFFSPLKIIEIDECPGCAGIWLDTGELKKIHDNHLTVKERALLSAQMANNSPFNRNNMSLNKPSSSNKKSDNLDTIFELAEFILSDF